MIEIIRELRSTTSTNMKESILIKYMADMEWRNYLVAVYNPFITYNKSGDKNELRNNLDNLKLCRSIDAGVSVKTINKVYGNIIPTHGQQKALNFKDFKHTKRRNDVIVFPCIAQYKYDGFSFTCIVRGANPVFYTSGGHKFLIEESIFDNMEDGVYLGEMLGKGVEGKHGDRDSCGIQTTFRTRTAKGLPNKGGQADFRIFEYLTHEEFLAGKAKATYEDRWLYMFHMNLDLEFDIAEVTADGMVCENQDELDTFYSEAIAHGWEGIMIRQPDHKWHNDGKRYVGLVKRKKRHTADLLCIDWEEGNGKYQGMIGALQLMSKDGTKVWVAPRTDADKQKDPAYYLDKIVEIVYESFSDTYVQPIFVTVREDKAHDDYEPIPIQTDTREDMFGA